MKKSLIITIYLIEAVLSLAVAVFFGVIANDNPGSGIVSVIFDAAIYVLFFILINKALKEEKKSIALGVCAIIFAGIVSGILYLVWCKKGTKEEEPKSEE